MHYRQIATLITQIFATAERLGSSVPKHLAAEHQQIAKLADSLRSLQEIPSDVAGAVLTALEAGNDPAQDESVRAAVIGREINATANGVTDRLGERGAAFITDNADELLDMFAKPFDAASTALKQAAERLGDADLDDTKAVLAKGGDAAQVWAAAQEAEKTIASIQTLWKQVVGFVPGQGSLDQRYRLLVIADIDPSEYLEQQLNTPGAHLRPFELARRGHHLSLATPTVLAQRVAAVQQEIQSRTSRASGAFQEEYRRLRGTGVGR